ncbi:hypothetical protein N7462_007932 [Penicillium macrosclerotiorum]|uniref:uncharacterized protein n=1 Tax=Penicillium macrosclerotiorum TaxID=303699 RepID=UPI00254793AC|nr:uncharacterized protein N7462_007932 [Penicillium macrosclerotiorum]KAJ5679688.1 hypothetical protein N7462_007932 [Penicillium macrosclerotiorum]
MEAWKTNPLWTDADVYHQTGWIMMNERDSDLAQRIRKNFQDCGHPDWTQDMTEAEVRRSWREVLKEADLSLFGSYYFNPSAGWADAGKALKIMAEATIQMGVKYQVGEATRLMLGDHGITGIETASGECFTASRILLATGAWTSQLMASVEDDLQMPTSVRIENQLTAAGVCSAHFQLSQEERELYDLLPVYVYGGEGEVLPPTAAGLLKFTSTTAFKNTIQTSTGHTLSVPPSTHQYDVPESIRKECISHFKRRLPQLFDDGREAEYFRFCWDAITPNQHPLITRHPHSQLSNLYFAAGGSFHCWKFLPIIGQYVVNVLNGTSNGANRDEAWKWKEESLGRGVHDKLIPNRDLRDY